jgi:hypothetical protein
MSYGKRRATYYIETSQQRLLELAADRILKGTSKPKSKRRRGQKAVNSVDRFSRAAVGLAYRVERDPDGTLRTIGRESPWW